MDKNCAQCGRVFTAPLRHPEKKTCSKVCYKDLQSSSKRKTLVAQTVAPKLFDISNLPKPEDLPAPYAKRVHDMWESLTTSGNVPTRIA
jgi:hypothetical protein